MPFTPQDREKVTVLAGGKTGIVSLVDIRVAAQRGLGRGLERGLESGLGLAAVPVAEQIKALQDRPADG